MVCAQPGWSFPGASGPLDVTVRAPHSVLLLLARLWLLSWGGVLPRLPEVPCTQHRACHTPDTGYLGLMNDLLSLDLAYNPQ